MPAKPKERKAAIDLSLGFIVTVVFAVVLLGLALTWVSGIFNPLNQITYKVTDVAIQNLMKDMNTGNKKVGIAAPAVTTWKRGETGSYALGVKNTDVNQKHTFYSNAYLEALGGDLAGTDPNSLMSDVNKWITPISPLELDPSQRESTAVIIKPSTQAATGIYSFRVCSCTSLSDMTCHGTSPGIYATSSPSLYGCQSFALEIA
jgi:hypothetical protein